ncbi:MAG: trigger factor [Patescibacteria group bacterium]
MKCNIKKLPKSELELLITVENDELKPFMEKAAQKLSEQTKIEGFRPGKASYDIVKARFGEHAILEEAAEDIVKKNFTKAIQENSLETVGHPKIEVTKMATNNPFEFKATVAILPEIKLGEYKNLGIKKQETKIDDKKIESVMQDLTKMQSKEVISEKPADKNGKIVVDMEMLKDGVAVEGGSAKNMAVYLAESHYIPGFNEELVNLKKGDEKNFSLNFPKEHYQKNLAGAKIDFKIKVNDVFEIQAPDLNDEFAKKLGQKSLEDLKSLIKKNLEHEAEHKDEDKWEIEILNKVVENSKFGDMPEILVNEEAHRMVHELEDNVVKQGMTFEDYLKSINKKESDLLLEFSPEAIKRIKISLAIREISKTEKLEANDKEIAEETEKMMNAYKSNPEAQKQIRTPEFADYIKTRLINRKTVDLIKKNN